MNTTKILKFLSSLPMIFVFLYFIPFVGICLILLRLFMYGSEKKKITSISLILVGVLLLIPELTNNVVELLKVDGDIFVSLKEMVSSDWYIKLIDYSKCLLTVGIIFMIITYVFNKVFNKLKNYLRSYISNQEKVNNEISRKNDLIIKEKQEKAKNTHVVFCSNCGADNMLVGKVGKCKYCRSHIEYKG